MKNVLIFLLVSFLLLPGIQGQSISVLTEEWAPFNFTQDGQVVGISTTLVRRTLDSAGISYTLKSYPWARAYDMAQKDPNTLIFTIARTQEREQLFQWIGPFFTRSINLYKLKSRQDIQISDFNNLKRYTIPLSLNNATRSELVRRGYPESRIQTVTGEHSAVLMLLLGRVDLLAGNPLVLKEQFQIPELRQKISWSDLEEVFPLISQDGYYMAYSKTTPAEVVERTRAAFNTLAALKVPEVLMKEFMASTQ